MRGALGCRIRFRQQMDRVTQARRAKRSDTKLKKNELFEAFYGPMRREVDRFRADERLPVKHLTFWAALSRQLHEDHPPSRQQRILHARYARDALEALDLDVKSARVNLAGHALPVVRLPDFQGKPALRFTNNPPHVPVKKER
jgi:hypothetical protein